MAQESQRLVEAYQQTIRELVTTVFAASGSARDIQAAVNQVIAISPNGTGKVLIPEGDFDFIEVNEAWFRVNIPAGISVFGAPTDRNPNTGQVTLWRTTIKVPYDVSGEMFRFYGSRDLYKPSRLSDLNLRGWRAFDTSQTSGNTGQSITIDHVANFRIDHCNLDNFGASNGINCYQSCGVIDHCKLWNDFGLPEPYPGTVGYGVMVMGDSTWDDNIYNVVGQYTLNTVFIEDCYFRRWRHCVASNDGGHYVFRHSTIDEDFGYGSLDAHGTFNIVSTRAIEVYDNYFGTVPQDEYGQSLIFWRGGGGVCFNNTFGPYETSYHWIHFFDEGAVEKCWLHNVYIWRGSGNRDLGIYRASGNATEGEDYFLYPMPNYTPYQYPHPLTLEALVTHTTPWTDILSEGTYKITTPAQFTDTEGKVWYFKYWSDDHANTNPVRTIALLSDMSIIAVYELTPIPPSISLVKVAAVIAAITVPVGGTALYMKDKRWG